MSKRRVDPSFWHNSRARRIVERIVVEGDLTLLSPAHFGNGDGSDETDLPLLTDSYDPALPLLTGASLAGALRAYLRRYLAGAQNWRAFDEALFGGDKGDDDGEQSPLIVDDALGALGARVELRDGVKLDPASRTASDQALFNIETWAAGTTFPLRLELLLLDREPGDDQGNAQQQRSKEDALRALAAALTGLTNGGITLGMRKQRGYGQARVSVWRVRRYRLDSSTDDLLDWLREGNASLKQSIPNGQAKSVSVVNGQGEPLPDVEVVAALLRAFGCQADPLQQHESLFELRAEFALAGSLMIRGNTGRDDLGPDMVHLRSWRNGQSVPIVSGASLAGALRARAARILNTLNPDKARATVDALFGPQRIQSGDDPWASRLITSECEVRNAVDDLVQNRIRIDRFTGGVMEGALFEEQPVFARPETRLTLRVQIREPNDHDTGLLLLLLKDLWTSDLPLGGEIGVGRGRLRGLSADLIHRRAGQEVRWRIEQAEGDRLTISGGDKRALEDFVGALHQHLRAEEVAHAA